LNHCFQCTAENFRANHIGRLRLEERRRRGRGMDGTLLKFLDERGLDEDEITMLDSIIQDELQNNSKFNWHFLRAIIDPHLPSHLPPHHPLQHGYTPSQPKRAQCRPKKQWKRWFHKLELSPAHILPLSASDPQPIRNFIPAFPTRNVFEKIDQGKIEEAQDDIMFNYHYYATSEYAILHTLLEEERASGLLRNE